MEKKERVLIASWTEMWKQEVVFTCVGFSA